MQIYQGLNAQQVQESRAKHGENTMSPPERIPAWKLFLQKFNDPIIKLLLFATLLSFITGYFHGSFAESFGILIAVFLATFLSFINEYRAAKEFDVLNQINDSVLVKVYREGNVVMIPKTEIVVGDYVIVEQGDEIPADGVVMEAMSLSVNESTLNGESVPAEKKPGEVDEFEGAYAPNRIYRGTTVSEGSGVMEVFAVGDATEIGKTARQATELTGQQTPLNQQLDKLSGIISKISFIVAGATFVALCILDFLVQGKSFDWSMETFEMLLSFFMIAVTLIVVAVPEGLAMSVTLSLAYSMRRMTASNTLVRKMHACETMGATTVICTDKTGTLTQNRMRVKEAAFAHGIDAKVAEAFASNSSAFLDTRDPNNIQEVGNPTECALLMALQDKGFDYVKIREEAKVVQRLVFSTERKYMATLVESKFAEGGHLKLYLKGAPEIVLKLVQGIDVPDILKEIAVYQNRGMRALGFLEATVETDHAELPIEELIEDARFSFQGFVAIEDPIRDDVPAAMQACTQAGIAVKIVTGDTAPTAREIARQAGLWLSTDTDENIITGVEFAALSEEDARQAALKIKVMARARPADKMRLVRLLQESGAVVAVTGDGTNDAPALNYANVGLSMGSGTSVAKEASDIILLDDSFASIVNAVRWGRSLYLNIQRFIQFQLTINVVALLTALIGPFIGVEFPLTVSQMLWVNLIMDTFAALALASEPSEPSVLKNKPRRREAFIITRPMAFNIFGVGLIFLGLLLAMLIFLQGQGGIDTHELTFFFTTFVLLQVWNLFNARVAGTNFSAFRHLNQNKSFVFIVLLILVLQMLIVSFGGDFFRTTPLSGKEWLGIVGATSLVLWIGELIRGVKRLLNKK